MQQAILQFFNSPGYTSYSGELGSCKAKCLPTNMLWLGGGDPGPKWPLTAPPLLIGHSQCTATKGFVKLGNKDLNLD